MADEKGENAASNLIEAEVEALERVRSTEGDPQSSEHVDSLRAWYRAHDAVRRDHERTAQGFPPFPSSAAWAKALGMEQRAFERLQKLEADAESKGSARHVAAAAEWLELHAKLLREYCGALAKPPAHHPPPSVAIARAAGLSKALAAGRLPEPFAAIKGAGGAPEQWPGERRDIAQAVFFVLAAKSNKVISDRPVAEVVEAFGVDRRTVQRWCERRDRYVAGLFAPQFEQVRELMESAGARYVSNREAKGGSG